MTTTWTAIRDGLAARVATITTLQVKARTPAAVNQDETMAIIELGPEGILPSAHANLVELVARVVLIVNRSTVTESEEAIDPYIWPAGVSSVAAAVKGDPTLGGIVDDATWLGSGTPYGTPQSSETGRQSEVRFKVVAHA